MNWEELRNEGLVHAQPWVLNRYCFQAGSMAYDVREAFDPNLFPNEQEKIDDRIFQDYWNNLLKNSSFYDLQQVLCATTIYFVNLGKILNGEWPALYL